MFKYESRSYKFWVIICIIFTGLGIYEFVDPHGEYFFGTLKLEFIYFLYITAIFVSSCITLYIMITKFNDWLDNL